MVVRVFHRQEPAFLNRERSVRHSAGLNAVKDSVRSGMAGGFSRISKSLIDSWAIK
jgi:hypothetical protein